MWLDRFLSAEIEAALDANPFRFLWAAVRFQEKPGLLDLRFRSSAKTRASEATLYLGADAAARLHYDPKKGISLHGCDRDGGLRKIKPEGRVEAAFCSDRERAVLDRQVAFSFRSQKDKNAVLGKLRGPVGTTVAAIAAANIGSFGKPPALGQEVDAIEVDAEGRLLVVEIKGPRDTNGIRWAPAQVTFYARIVSHWLATDSAARDVLARMLDERARFGLCPALNLPATLTVTPVVAVGLPVHNPQVAPAGAQAVQQDLLAAGVGWPNLEAWGVEQDGSITPLAWF